MGRAKGLRGTESRGGAGPDGDPEEYQPASRHAEERGLRAGSGGSRAREEGDGGCRWRQSRAAAERQAGGRTERRGPKTARAVRTGKWPHPLPSASTPFENPELNGTPGISGPSGIPPLAPTPSLPSGVKCTPVPKCLPHTFCRVCQSLPSCPFLAPPYLFSPSDPGG